MAHRGLPPLSPISQYMNSSTLSVYFIGVCELEIPFNKSRTVEFFRDVFVPTNTRFSSLIVTDEKGIQRWKKVEIMLEDHVIVPTFPSGLSKEEYEEEVEEYLSKIAMDQIPENRPPWEVHLIMYQTCNAAGTLALKMNHAIGDGYSLMGVLFSCLKRADNPSLPLSFPSSSSRLRGRVSSFSKISSFVSRYLNTVSDFTLSVLQGTFLEDDKTAIRSGMPGVEFEPIAISSVTFSLNHIAEVKSKVGGTVNDVIIGLISYALRLYMKRMGQASSRTRTTALVILNMRMLRGFHSLEEMLRANIWGNHFGFLHLSVPLFNDVENVDPLEFIITAKKEMRRKLNSSAVYFTSRIISMLRSIRRAEEVAKYVHSSMDNTSIMISNLMGPNEKVTLAGHPINSMYFTAAGIPQSLLFNIVSYMGKLRLVATTKKEFINSQLLISCIKEAFKKIYEVAGGEDQLISN